MLKNSRCYKSEAEHTQGTVQSIEPTTYPIFTTIVFEKQKVSKVNKNFQAYPEWELLLKN